MFDAIVVGSGPAGVSAALALRGKNVLVLDVGREPAAASGDKDDPFEFLIGRRFESLHNLHAEPMSLKLKAPGMRYITEDAAELSPVRSTSFSAAMSFAAGGLANAWGAGVYRFTDRDLEGFPIRAAELAPFYDELGRLMGISGADDDLVHSLGFEKELQPPLELSRFAADLLAGYERQRGAFAREGVSIGRTRLAVLTEPHRGRAPYAGGNREFFRAHDPAVYNPAYTLRELVEAREVRYEPGYLVLRYAEAEGRVAVTARNLRTGAEECFEGRALILAAGALNSAKIVLTSSGDTATRLPLMDNPMACLPLIRLSRIGQKRDRRDTSLGQLILIQEYGGKVLQGSIYGTGGPLRSDILFELPLAISANAAVLRRLEAATGLLMMFYPADPRAENYLRLSEDGALEISYTGESPRGEAERVLVRLLRKAGFYTSMAMCQYPPMGSGIHYAGTLPMRESPTRYELDSQGLLQGTRAVYVADGACFPRLPAKNLTFTIMANAMRIASRIRYRL